MLNKLLKNDLKKSFSWIWILFVVTIACAGLARMFDELSDINVFFTICQGFFTGGTYALIGNSMIQPLIRNCVAFKKDMYGDQSYLMHTLPVTKTSLLLSKYFSGIITIFAGLAASFVAIAIMIVSPELILAFKTAIAGSAFEIIMIVLLACLLIFAEICVFVSIIYFAIILAFKTVGNKNFKAVLIAVGFGLLCNLLISGILAVVLTLMGVDLAANTLPVTAMFVAFLVALVINSLFVVLFNYLSINQLKKGVNVD